MTEPYCGPNRRAEIRSRRDADNGWHLSRQVPVAIILVLVLQISSFIWVAAQLDAQVSRNRDTITEIRTQVGKMPERLLVVETLLRRVEASLTRDRP